MRTDAQEQAFAKECLKIENAGGDVLAYIAKEYPSYTPRPVWYRLQRNYLKRKTDQLTEGRPKIPERKEVDEVRKETRNSQEDTVRALIDAHKAGKSIRECLQELGYTNVASALRNAKGWARKNRPDLAKELDHIGLGRAPAKPEEPVREPVTDNTGENPTEPKKAPETPKKRESGDDEYLDVRSRVNEVFFGGKVYEKMDKPSPTCCQPAKPSGVTVPDELPEESLKIAALLSSFDPDFRYELSNIKSGKNRVVSLVWREPMGGAERSLNLTTDEWKLFAKEIPRMLKQLGLI